MGGSPDDAECREDEKPAHEVTIATGFWMGRTPVTQAAFERVMGRNSSRFRGANLPVESVSWDEASAYSQAVGLRLPSEAEWEYAARGGDPGGRTHEVAQKQPNRFGLFDTLGNVWEWTADWYDPSHRALRGGSWLSDPESARVSDRGWSGPPGRVYGFGFRCVGQLADR